MATVKQVLGARTFLNTTGLPSLASGTYAASDSYNCNTNQPLDVVAEVTAQASAPAGNKQVVVFIQESLDGVAYRSGPISGTVTSDEMNLRYMGVVPLNSSTTQRATFSVVAALGYVPFAFRIVIKNEAGVALGTGTVYTSELTTTVA